jgi:TRAP-type C4-dicarboxylate transport system permease small subunit
VTPARPSRFVRLARRLEAALGFASGLVLFAMMALTFVDVVGRYAFNRSVPGSFEITEIMMAMLIFAGLPLVSRREEHVTVDLVDHLLPAKLRRVLRVIVELACGGLLLGLTHLMWRKAGTVASYGDTTTVLLIKYAPFAYAIVAFLFLAAIVHLINVFAPAPAPGEGRDKTV